MFVNEPQLLKGKWNDFTNGKIHLEIGSGKGDYWIGMSKLYPTDFFVGVEQAVRNSNVIKHKIIFFILFIHLKNTTIYWLI